ncbi:TPA: WD40 repeat domain-containing protein [Candidatus Poribacteria bacterium]|nr:WD40 repeat domain-containing protein [Candidatus Poribacteria bacterium]
MKIRITIILFLFLSGICVSAPVSPIWSVDFSPDGKLLAVGTYQWLEIWDLQTRQTVKTFEDHADAVRSVMFLNGGDRVVAAGGSPSRFGELKFWLLDDDSEPYQNIQIHADTIEAISVSPSGEKIVTASMDKTVILTNISFNGEKQILTQHVDRVLAADFRHDGKYFATAGADKTIKIWSAETYLVVVSFDQNDGAVNTVRFGPDNLIVSGSTDHVVRSWRIIESDRGIRGILNRIYYGHNGPVYAVDCGVFNGQVIIVSGSADHSVIVWDFQSGNKLFEFNQPDDEVYAVNLSIEGRFLVSGGRDGIIRIWDLTDGKMIANFQSGS